MRWWEVLGGDRETKILNCKEREEDPQRTRGKQVLRFAQDDKSKK